MKISPARVAAFSVLVRVEKDRAFTSILLPEFEAGLDRLDRGLCHQLTLGVLRKQFFLDEAIRIFGGGKKLDLEVRVSLRLGLYQIYFLDRIPAHSAVNDSVALVKLAKKTSASGFVNAILRRAAREPFVPAFSSHLEHISLETSHPQWILERWTGRFGQKEAIRLAEANNKAPAAAFRYTLGRPGTLEATPSDVVPNCYIAPAVSTALMEAAARGEIYFQDEGSQLVGSCVHVADAGSFLDVCSAPGSKLTQIAATCGGARLFVGGDRYYNRVSFLKHNIENQKVLASSLQYDAETALPFEERSFDTVLVDAPCSGTGTIRHNPEIRYFLSPNDLTSLSAKQLRILENASKMVKSGGELIYSTCSLESEENEGVTEAFVSRFPSFRKELPNVPRRFIDADGYARTLPGRDDMDGFFVARFIRGHG